MHSQVRRYTEKDLSEGASVPVELGYNTLPVCGYVFTHLQAPRTPRYWDFLMEAFSHRHDRLLIPFLAPHPSLENGRWD